MNEFWYGVSDFFKATFEILPKLGNMPNVLLSIVGFVALSYWVAQLIKHKRAGEA
ncbi:MAG: hypothetical protein ACI8ZO_000353 [Flavobacteriales bacterium]|jgi:hypothetical protein